MRLLLPPSEAKASGGDGPPLRQVGTGPGPLGSTRRDVLDALRALCRAEPGRAREVLRLPAGSADRDVADGAAVWDAPTLPALDRFRGVLFEALDVPTLTPAERALADEAVLVFAGAFGVLRGAEPVPAHRVPAAAALPGVGPLTAAWRAPVRAVMDAHVAAARVLVDLRSTDYAALWRPPAPVRGSVVPVRVLVERRAGGRLVRRAVSHPGKVGKGRLARELLRRAAAGAPPRSARDVADAGEAVGLRAEVATVVGGQQRVDLVGDGPTG